jgi:hypothetical protein
MKNLIFTLITLVISNSALSANDGKFIKTYSFAYKTTYSAGGSQITKDSKLKVRFITKDVNNLIEDDRGSLAPSLKLTVESTQLIKDSFCGNIAPSDLLNHKGAMISSDNKKLINILRKENIAGVLTSVEAIVPVRSIHSPIKTSSDFVFCSK